MFLSCKNIFFLKKEDDVNSLSVLSKFDSNIKIERINTVIPPNEMSNFQAYVFDEFHVNGGVCQMRFNSENFKNICKCNCEDKSLLYGVLSRSFQNEKEALKIMFIVFYAILCLNFEFVGITAVNNYSDSYEYDCKNFNITYLSIGELSSDSLLDLQEDTILLVHNK